MEVSTVSSGLALLSELRWYIMRYICEVLIEDAEHGVYLTQGLAREAYDARSLTLTPEWESRFSVCITGDGEILRLLECVPEPDDACGVCRVGTGLMEEHP